MRFDRILSAGAIRLSVGLVLTATLLLELYAFQSSIRQPNHLASEKSPYLRQHINNLVDWYPWGEEAFRRAKSEDKPIFLSIGFSTCYWCHLMAEECFNDEKIASFMNKHFVSIKVDREERPDVDQIYMSFVQASTGKSGWPLSVFLTTDREPFYGGGYFTSDDFYSQVKKIADEWRDNRKGVLEAGTKVTNLIKTLQEETRSGDVLIGLELLESTYQWYLKAFDPVNGGFGSAPKFPRPDDVSFLLRHHFTTGKQGPLRMARVTLTGMAKGGLRDHLGGGFHRYSTDARWFLPRFEKLLFIQAGLAINYLEAYQVAGDPLFAETARGMLDYVLRKLRGPEGAFLSSMSSGSPCPGDEEKRCEGVFYTWSDDEVSKALQEDAVVFRLYYGIEPQGNITETTYEGLAGTNVLYVAQTAERVAEKAGLEVAEVEARLKRSRAKMLKLRSLRPQPEMDDKVLAGWNGLMISALCKGYQVLGEEAYLKAAIEAADFVAARLYDEGTKSLRRRFRDGETAIDGYLDDYALYIQGLLDLYESDLQGRWLELALDLTEKQIALFLDEDRGGFFNSSGQDLSLLMRMKELYDGVEPSPNAISVSNLLRLSLMSNNSKWKAVAELTIRSFQDRYARSPHSMPQMKAAAGYLLKKPAQIVIAGDADDLNARAILREVHRRFIPYRVVILADGGNAFQRLSIGSPLLRTMRPLGGKATAYICEDFACKYPTSDPVKVGELLDELRLFEERSY